VKAYVSLWSADQLALGEAVDLLDDIVDGFHMDVFDGHNVRDLLFGPELVAALRQRTTNTLDVHLNVTDPDYWVDRFAEAGADMLTVQTAPCPDLDATLARIRDRGCQASLGLERHEPVSHAVDHFGGVDRVLLLGTQIGVKGRDLDPAAAGRIRQLATARHGATAPAIVVDGGIRIHTVPALAAAGADGVVPGSLVFGDPDPRRAAAEIRALRSGQDPSELPGFWTAAAP
jgi:ribulose-phosphate 3-epimerase